MKFILTIMQELNIMMPNDECNLIFIQMQQKNKDCHL
jgi:hypothetical protein